MQEEITQLAKALSTLDYIINEGVMFNESEVRTLELYTEQLETMIKTIKLFNQVK